MAKKIVKTMLTACVLILSCVSVISCSTTKISEDAGITRYTNVKEKTADDLVYPAVYVRTDGSDTTAYPKLVTLTTREELEKYTSDYETIYDFATNSYSISFYDAATKYDSSFFESSSLVIAILNESSSSYTHSNRGFSKTDSGYSLNLIRFIPSGESILDSSSINSSDADSTDNGATWHIFFEVPKTSPVLDSDIEISITDENVSV